jgi:hypothetical protein
MHLNEQHLLRAARWAYEIGRVQRVTHLVATRMGHLAMRLVVRTKRALAWDRGAGPAGAVPWGNTLLAFRFVVAVAHGNRTHRGRLSAPATGFEDRASHQIRKRYREGKYQVS